MSKKRYSGIFFDLGGTLLFPDPKFINESFSRHFSVNLGAARWLESIHYATWLWDEEIAAGKADDADWWRSYFSKAVNYAMQPKSIPAGEMNKFLEFLHHEHLRTNLWSHQAEDVFEILESLKNEGYVLGLISNSDGRVAKQLEETGLAKFFAFALDSWVVGCSKPEPEIFNIAFKTSGLPPEELLYVGDFVNIDWKGATACGMDCVIIDPLNLRKDATASRIRSLKELPVWIAGKST